MSRPTCASRCPDGVSFFSPLRARRGVLRSLGHYTGGGRDSNPRKRPELHEWEEEGEHEGSEGERWCRWCYGLGSQPMLKHAPQSTFLPWSSRDPSPPQASQVVAPSGLAGRRLANSGKRATAFVSARSLQPPATVLTEPSLLLTSSTSPWRLTTSTPPMLAYTAIPPVASEAWRRAGFDDRSESAAAVLSACLSASVTVIPRQAGAEHFLLAPPGLCRLG